MCTFFLRSLSAASTATLGLGRAQQTTRARESAPACGAGLARSRPATGPRSSPPDAPPRTLAIRRLLTSTERSRRARRRHNVQPAGGTCVASSSCARFRPTELRVEGRRAGFTSLVRAPVALSNWRQIGPPNQRLIGSRRLFNKWLECATGQSSHLKPRGRPSVGRLPPAQAQPLTSAHGSQATRARWRRAGWQASGHSAFAHCFGTALWKAVCFS